MSEKRREELIDFLLLITSIRLINDDGDMRNSSLGRSFLIDSDRMKSFWNSHRWTKSVSLTRKCFVSDPMGHRTDLIISFFFFIKSRKKSRKTVEQRQVHRVENDRFSMMWCSIFMREHRRENHQRRKTEDLLLVRQKKISSTTSKTSRKTRRRTNDERKISRTSDSLLKSIFTFVRVRTTDYISNDTWARFDRRNRMNWLFGMCWLNFLVRFLVRLCRAVDWDIGSDVGRIDDLAQDGMRQVCIFSNR